MRIDDRIESYGQIYDFDWAKKLVEVSDPAPVLQEMLLDLCISFQGVSTTLAIPALAVDVAKAYADSAKLGRLSDSLQLRYSEHIVARLRQSHALNGSIERELLAQMLKWIEEVHEIIKGEAIPFPRQELWDEYVTVEANEPIDSHKTQFRVGIFAAQRLAYSALFFAYEDFFLQLLARMGHGGLWTMNPKFPGVCEQVFGQAVADRCWWDTKIEDAKLVRHSLAHAGGRVTDKLRNRNHGIDVLDDRLQVMPRHVVALNNELKECVLMLAQWAVGKPEFGPQK